MAAVAGQTKKPRRRTALDFDLELAERYHAEALAAYVAIDHPHSLHVGASEADKAAMREERGERLRERAARLQELQARWSKAQQRRARREELAAQDRGLQLRLFADSWPEPFSYIAERFPRRPYVSNDLSLGTLIRPLQMAGSYRYLQHNPPSHDHVLVIDYDAEALPVPAKEAWRAAGLPAPTWIAQTPGTARGHLAWALATPVCTSHAARLGPMRYLAAIEQAYCRALHGDDEYVGLLTKNPINSSAWDTQWIEPTAYTLEQLAEAVQLPKPDRRQRLTAPIEPVGLGRKVGAFESTRHWAYSAVSGYWGAGYDVWYRAVRTYVDTVNGGFREPLPEAHIKSIAKSVATWVWRRFTPSTKATLVAATHTPAVQALRGRQKGAKVRDEKMETALQRIASGESQKAVAGDLGVTDRTLRNWIRRAQQSSQVSPADLH
jgi:transposase-like protein